MKKQEDFIEMRILSAIRGLLTGRVNEILRKGELTVPVVEFVEYGCGYATAPVIALSTCERTEKERVIKLDAYTLTITFTLPETPESELHCYAYSGAVSRAIYDDPTLGGAAERAVMSGRKYVSPKRPHCGGEWGVIITLRVTVEESGNAG
jgi:hypothetical protein